MRTLLRLLCCISLIAVIVVFAASEPRVSAETPELKKHSTIEAPVSSNSSSGSIMITMTGVVDNEGYDE